MTTLRGIAARVGRAMRRIGLALVVLGVIACLAPLASGVAVALLVGLVLLGAGGGLVLFGLGAREAGKGNLGLLMGALAGICGLVLLIQPTAGLDPAAPAGFRRRQAPDGGGVRLQLLRRRRAVRGADHAVDPRQLSPRAAARRGAAHRPWVRYRDPRAQPSVAATTAIRLGTPWDSSFDGPVDPRTG